MIGDIVDVPGESATRFGILLDAARRGNAVLAAEMVVTIPAADLLAIEQRLALFDIDLRALVRGDRP